MEIHNLITTEQMKYLKFKHFWYMKFPTVTFYQNEILELTLQIKRYSEVITLGYWKLDRYNLPTNP